MLFNSTEYFVFFLLVLILYYFLGHRWQNRILLVASYFFYGWWDWRFLFLIFISTVTDYYCAIQIENRPTRGSKKPFLILSLVVNLSLLGFFKYWDFFIESFRGLLSQFGFYASPMTLQVILPIGISFYIFKTISYSIDVYRGEIKPTTNFFDYALFVSFFPQLLAGPIERAKAFLPQIEKSRKFIPDQFMQGMQLIFWGIFQKVFVADNLGVIVDQIYKNPDANGVQYVIATWAFTFQIFCDFSGYTDIARGTSNCFGIEIMENFKQPYFATNPPDFWRRWHISLSSWLRDYLYIPLGGNRGDRWKTYRNLMVTMVLCGLWHGAAWNFILWGAYHGLALVGYRWVKTFRKSGHKGSNSLSRYMIKAFLMFQLTWIGWIFFRSENIGQSLTILERVFSVPNFLQGDAILLVKVMFFVSVPLIVMAVQTVQQISPAWFERNLVLNYMLFSKQAIYFKSILYGAMAYLLILHGASAKTFIYFQF